MPTTTVLSRVKNDSVAILVPGSFVLLIIISVYLALTHKDQSSGIIKRIAPFFKVFTDYWPLFLVLFIIAYLVGILIRAIRVNLADMLSKKIFEKFNRSKWIRLGYESEFPYPVILEDVKKELLESNMISSYSLPNEKNLHNVYNFWKMIICLESQDVFSHIQNLESIVRLFVGMFWSGFIGVIGYLITLGGCLLNKIIRDVWLDFTLVMLVVSVIILIMFGMNIRRVRVQEVVVLFMAYLVIHQKKEQEEKKNRVKKKNENLPHTFEFLAKMFEKKD